MSEPYTPQEQTAYDEGHAAYHANVDYFDSPYMRQTPRNLFFLCAWTAGWLDAEAEVSCAKCEGQHDPSLPCIAQSAEAEDRRTLRV